VNKLIFLIEDDTAIADVYKIIMEKSNFDVDIFGSGKEVIKVIKKLNNTKKDKKPDIILLDLILPDMNGIDILREIRNNDLVKDVKVFILTNQEDVRFNDSDSIKPDKVIIKANITPTDLVNIVKEELK